MCRDMLRKWFDSFWGRVAFALLIATITLFAYELFDPTSHLPAWWPRWATYVAVGLPVFCTLVSLLVFWRRWRRNRFPRDLPVVGGRL